MNKLPYKLPVTQKEVAETGILPCSHPAEREDDRLIIDHCFECGWMTPSRRESNKLNEIAATRANEEGRLINFVRSGSYTSDKAMSGLHSAELKEMMDSIHELWEWEQSQRLYCKMVQEEEDVR